MACVVGAEWEAKVKLSEAIREGAKRRPQAFGYYRNKVGGKWGTCAIGAAYEAITGANAPTMDDPVGPLAAIIDPLVGNERVGILGVVARMNDEEKRPREEIADWLETQGY